MNPTTELLAILGGAAEPRPLNAYGHVDFRTRAARQWFERFEARLGAAVDMIDAGLAEVVIEADGYRRAEIGITEAGRRYLGQTRAVP